jgi:hypothetical protein
MLPMARVIVVEPVPAWHDGLRGRLAGLGGRLEIAGSIAEAQECAAGAHPCLVLARNTRGEEAAAAAACGFDLSRGPRELRLVLFACESAGQFCHEVERTVAESLLPVEVRAASVEGLPPEFPHPTYHPIRRVGRLACAELLLVQHRISGLKELLVQVQEGDYAAEVAGVLYRNFRARGAVAGKVLRHELTRHHSFIAPGSIPFDLARDVYEAAAALSIRQRAA